MNHPSLLVANHFVDDYIHLIVFRPILNQDNLTLSHALPVKDLGQLGYRSVASLY